MLPFQTIVKSLTIFWLCLSVIAAQSLSQYIWNMVSQPNMDPYTKNFLRTSVAQEMFDIEMPPSASTTPPPEGSFGRPGGEAAQMQGMSPSSEAVYGAPPSRGWNGASNQPPRRPSEAMGAWLEGPQQHGNNLGQQSEQILVNPQYDARNAPVFRDAFESPQSRYMSQRMPTMSNWESYPTRQELNMLPRTNEFSQSTNNQMEYGSSGNSNFQGNPRGNDLNQEYIPRNGQYRSQGNMPTNYQNQGNNPPNHQNQGNHPQNYESSNPPNYQNQRNNLPNYLNHGNNPQNYQGSNPPNYQNQGNNPPNYQNQGNNPPNYQNQGNNPPNYQNQGNNPQNSQGGNPSNYQNKVSNPPNYQNQENVPANYQRQRASPTENAASVYQKQNYSPRNAPMNIPERFQNYENNPASVHSSRKTVNSQSNPIPNTFHRNVVSQEQFVTTTMAPLPDTMPDINAIGNMPSRSEAVGNSARQSISTNRDANAQDPFLLNPARDNPTAYQMGNNNQRNGPVAIPRYPNDRYFPEFNNSPGPFMGSSQMHTGSGGPPQLPLGRNILGRPYSMPPFMVNSNTQFPADLFYYRQPSPQSLGAFPFGFESLSAMQATPPPQFASFAAMRMPSSQDMLKSGPVVGPRKVPSPYMMDQMMAMVGYEGVEVI